MRNVLARLFLALVLCLSMSAKGLALPPLSEAEVVSALTDSFSAFYKTSAPRSVPVSKVDVKVSNIQIGKIIQHQLQYGKLAEDIYPVRAEVEISIHYTQNVGPDKVVRGAKSSIGREGFAFFKNGFDEWASTYMSY